MIVGVPKEIKNNENRVAITPAGVEEMVKAGHQVYIEDRAGVGSGISNEEYVSAGAQLLSDPSDVFAASDLIIKVKEPQPQEWDYFKEGQILFTYLHLATELELTQALLDKKL